jgi:hypothetical protein
VQLQLEGGNNMRVLLSPQTRVGDNSLTYSFENETITVALNGITDIFDFSVFSDDGELDVPTIETVLEVQPILSAKRENGVLSVVLLSFISEDATEEEKFPTWIEV